MSKPLLIFSLALLLTLAACGKASSPDATPEARPSPLPDAPTAPAASDSAPPTSTEKAVELPPPPEGLKRKDNKPVEKQEDTKIDIIRGAEDKPKATSPKEGWEGMDAEGTGRGGGGFGEGGGIGVKPAERGAGSGAPAPDKKGKYREDFGVEGKAQDKKEGEGGYREDFGVE